MPKICDFITTEDITFTQGLERAYYTTQTAIQFKEYALQNQIYTNRFLGPYAYEFN